MHTFSVFPDGITNTTAPIDTTIRRVFETIKGEGARTLTTWIRQFKAEGDATAQSNAKCKLPYACFSGTFSKRAVAGLIAYNGMVIADIDHCQEAEEIRDILAEDPHCALVFVSPSGDGVKALFLTENTDPHAHKAAFATVAAHCKTMHGLDLDPSGSDISRACFLGHDPGAKYNEFAIALHIDLSLAPRTTERANSTTGPNVAKWNREKISKNRHDYLFAYCRHLACAGASVDEIIVAAEKMQEMRFEPKNGKPYADQREIVRQAEGAVLMFGGGADPVADQIAMDRTLEAWDAESVTRGQETASAHVLTEEQERTADALKSMLPPHLLTPGGIIQDVMGLIESQEIRTQPVLRLGAALACVGSLMGRNYRSQTNGRSNLYCLGIADSGTGKDAARGAIKMIFNGVASDDPMSFDDIAARIAAEDVASGAGLLTLLQNNPVRLLLWDEFGKVLASVLGKYAEGYKAAVCKELLRTYSSAATSISGTAKADQNACPLITIHNPHLSVWGTTTGATLWDVIGPQSFLDGLLPRFLFFIGDDMPELHDSVYHPELPFEIKTRIKSALDAIKEHNKESSQDQFADSGRSPKIAKLIPRSPGANRAFLEYSKTCEDRRVNAKKIDDSTGPLWTRAVQKADQVSIILAWSKNPEDPVVTEQDAQYAIDLATWSTQVFIEHANEHISENPFQKLKNKVLIALKNAGREGMPSWLLAKKTLSGVDERLRDSIMKTIDQEKAFVCITSDPAKNGKRKKTLYLTKYAPAEVVAKLDPDLAHEPFLEDESCLSVFDETGPGHASPVE